MKKILTLLTVILILNACQKTQNNEANIEETATVRQCAADEVLQAQMNADPSLRLRIQQIEAFTENILKDPNSRLLPNGTIEIPVVVNVLYKTPEQNISDAQIATQIDVLNEDF